MTIRRLRLPTNAVARTAEFYGSVLGLRTEETPGGVRVWVGEGEIEFEAGAATPQHFAFAVARRDFASTKGWLSAQTPLIRSTEGDDEFPLEEWSSISVYFRDPDGNILELIARDSDLPVEGHRLLRLAEVGVATPDVAVAVDELGLPTYRSGSAVFQAVGDEEGLLIVVSNGREFFPSTGVRATAVNGEVTYEHAGAVRTLSLA